MAGDGVESMSTTVAQTQNDAWETKLQTYVNDRRPPSFTLSGPAVDEVQSALDKFVKDVDTMFDDNLDLGLLVHEVMVGQRQLIVEERGS